MEEDALKQWKDNEVGDKALSFLHITRCAHSVFQTAAASTGPLLALLQETGKTLMNSGLGIYLTSGLRKDQQ